MVASLRPISTNLNVLVRELKLKSIYLLDLFHGQTKEHSQEQFHYHHNNRHMQLARSPQSSSVVRAIHSLVRVFIATTCVRYCSLVHCTGSLKFTRHRPPRLSSASVVRSLKPNRTS